MRHGRTQNEGLAVEKIAIPVVDHGDACGPSACSWRSSRYGRRRRGRPPCAWSPGRSQRYRRSIRRPRRSSQSRTKNYAVSARSRLRAAIRAGAARNGAAGIGLAQQQREALRHMPGNGRDSRIRRLAAPLMAHRRGMSGPSGDKAPARRARGIPVSTSPPAPAIARTGRARPYRRTRF